MDQSAGEMKFMGGRTNSRQNKTVPFLINDNGDLYPNTPSTCRLPGYRPYHGDPFASKEQRLAYLHGKPMAAVEPVETFDLATADKPELLEFALNEYGVKLDSRKSLENLRAEIMALAKEE